MHAINADTFAAAVAIGFQSRGEFGIGRPGPLLDMWLQQQSDEVVLSMVVDPSTARQDKGLHEVLADIIGSARGRRWGIRVVLSGYPQPVEGSDALHWIVDASDIHAPAVSLAGEASGGEASPHAAGSSDVVAPSAAACAQGYHADHAGDVGSSAAPVVDEGLGFAARGIQRLRDEGRVVMVEGSAADTGILVATLERLDYEGIHAHTSDAIDDTVGPWSQIRSARIHPVRRTHQVVGSSISMEAVLETVGEDGKVVNTDILVTVSGVTLWMEILPKRTAPTDTDRLRAILPGIASVI